MRTKEKETISASFLPYYFWQLFWLKEFTWKDANCKLESTEALLPPPPPTLPPLTSAPPLLPTMLNSSEWSAHWQHGFPLYHTWCALVFETFYSAETHLCVPPPCPPPPPQMPVTLNGVPTDHMVCLSTLFAWCQLIPEAFCSYSNPFMHPPPPPFTSHSTPTAC